jgi:copper transport protein
MCQIRRSIVITTFLIISTTVLLVRPLLAHANLLRSDPPANAALTDAPEEIRLWFSEPLEAAFSRIELRDSQGSPLDTPPAEVDPADAMQMSLRPGELPDGVYTVAWQVVSSADGHATRGTFAFSVGVAAAFTDLSTDSAEGIPAGSAFIRLFNLLSMALSVGGVGFMLFVWHPVMPAARTQAEIRMRRMIWAGWLMLGAAAALMLLMQVSTVADVSIVQAMTDPALGLVMSGSRFGQLWLARVLAWLAMGALILMAGRWPHAYWGALAAGGVALVTQSLFSHAQGTPHALPAVAADWLHLAAAALWIGGLAQFASIVQPLRHEFTPAASVLSQLVGSFSDLARACVTMLIITGAYSAWLLVGSVEALLTTPYGYALTTKIMLMLPLLGLGAVNLLLTHRRLLAGETVWEGRLLGLVSAEIVLAVGVLAAVGVMTAIEPARYDLAQRQAVESQQPRPWVESAVANNIRADLEISPGWAGSNTFSMQLYDDSGSPIADASLIRLRFEHQTQNIGESELRPEHQGDGLYATTGANLSVAGNWRIRVMIQRPDEFDTVVDFVLQVTQPPPPQQVDTSLPAQAAAWALLLTGAACLGAGGFFAAQSRLRLRYGSGLLAAFMLMVGGIFLYSGIQAAPVILPAIATAVQFDPPPTSPVNMVMTSRLERPVILTAAGTVLRPSANDAWQPLPLDAAVSDVHVDAQGIIWAAAENGLYAYHDDGWQSAAEEPAHYLTAMHGYLFALGDGSITRLLEGSSEPPRLLSVPNSDQPADAFVMLGDHSHILQNGGTLHVTDDMGLSWQPIDAPGPVTTIDADPDGNLLAVINGSLRRWNWSSRSWSTAAPLPDDQPIDTMRIFQDRLYVVAGGNLYRLAGNQWQSISISGADSSYFTALAVEFPCQLWVLDARHALLWFSSDAEEWSSLAVNVDPAISD